MDELNALPTQGGLYEYKDGQMVAIEGGPAAAEPAPAKPAPDDVDQPTGDPA